METLILSNRPARTLREIEPWFWRHIPKDQVVLGGGTALAARWKHRVSTDIDLFMADDALARIDRRRAGSSVLDHVSSLRANDDGIILRTKSGGDLSLSPTRAAFSPLAAPDEEAQGLAVMRTDLILLFKIAGRMLRERHLVARDMYDLAVAACMDPKAYRLTMAWFAPDVPISIAAALHTKPAGFRAQEVIDPKFPDLNENLLDMSRFLLANGLDAFRKEYGKAIESSMSNTDDDDQGHMELPR